MARGEGLRGRYVFEGRRTLDWHWSLALVCLTLDSVALPFGKGVALTPIWQPSLAKTGKTNCPKSRNCPKHYGKTARGAQVIGKLPKIARLPKTLRYGKTAQRAEVIGKLPKVAKLLQARRPKVTKLRRGYSSAFGAWQARKSFSEITTLAT